ncbi:MAG: hypothetical protein US42_C0003G0039 [Candidatus Magasanikbacteria bacterium GW2011_GWC2_37_14]|uniref:DUF559 domain-containing protein n=1 Tax=Candidatus Magasanikbacteria bacterium GW2011_GWC2_37_14 TaxID=1619046 RepID=A0A0G0GDA0_9BACT|nr:MAG: hypothetical protein US42_C0003G0039 [Candidatus Magasanikbacteria bacterium GW2011_GWC2_37_14]
MTDLYNKKEYTFIRRKLRKETPKGEQILWQKLRRKTLGCKFRRQYGIGKYVVDFYCQELRLAIEVDGITHEDKADYEKERNQFLKCKNIKVLHFRSEEIFYNLDNLVEGLYNLCEELKTKL